MKKQLVCIIVIIFSMGALYVLSPRHVVLRIIPVFHITGQCYEFFAKYFFQSPFYFAWGWVSLSAK
jgi:hypothetical protein